MYKLEGNSSPPNQSGVNDCAAHPEVFRPEGGAA